MRSASITGLPVRISSITRRAKNSHSGLMTWFSIQACCFGDLIGHGLAIEQFGKPYPL
jgi:hypothetical protein